MRDRFAPRLRPLRLEDLEPRRLLSVNPFSAYANDLETKLAAIQTTLDSALDAVSGPLKSLPFIGPQLGQVDQVKAVIDNVGNQIQSQLTSFSMAGATSSDLQNQLYRALGPSGLNILGGANDGANSASLASDIHVSNFQLYGSGLIETADVEMRLHEDATVGSPSVAFHVGVPSLPIQITSTGGISLTVGFDFELAVDYNSGSISMPVKTVDDYSPSLSANQLVFSVAATLSSNASLTADLGLLTGTLVPTPSQPNTLSAQVTVNGLSLLGSPTVAFTGSADVNLTATLGLGDGGADFPSISTDLSMSWPDLTDPSSLTFSYDNLALNLGQFLTSFVGPIVTEIQTYTQPIQSVINVLTTPIPGLDQLPGLGSFSLLTLLTDLGDGAGLGSVADAIQDVATLVTDVDNIRVGSNNVSLTFGSFTFSGSAIAAAAPASDLTNVFNLLSNSTLSSITTSDLTSVSQNAMNSFNLNSAIPGGLTSPATTALNQLNTNASITFPLLDHPSQLLDLLFGQGQNVDLVNVNLNINYSSNPINIFSTNINIWGPITVDVSLTAGFGASASLVFGYDTYGIQEALAQLQSGSPSPSQLASDIGNGFYVQQSGTYLNFSVYTHLFAGVGIGVDIGLASAGASVGVLGGVTANLTIGLNPHAAVDDKIRLSSLVSEFNSGNLFDVSGDITASLSLAAHYYARFLWWSTTGNWTFCNIGTWTIWSFSSANSSSSAPPLIAGISPDSGPTAGGTDVIIYGSNLENASAVDFGGAPGAVILNSDASFIEFSTPPGSGTVNVSVTTAGGTATDSGAFTYVPAPTVSSIATGAFTPPSGPTAGGREVTITGTNLENATAVDFGSDGQGSIVPGSNTATAISVLSPPGAAGTLGVTVVTPGGTSATSPADLFTYVPLPIITSIVSDSGPQAGGNFVTINGQYLNGPPLYVAFGSNVAPRSAIIPVSSTELRVRVPASTNPGTVDVQVLTSGGLSAISEPDDLYTYIPPPVISYITPNSGPLSGKTGIEITGYHFGGATAVDFELQAGTITSLYEIDPAIDLWTMIATAPPAYMYGEAEVRVTTLGGTSSLTSVSDPYYDIYFYTAAPVVSTVSPSSGPLSGGTLVTIAGSQLAGAQEVGFGGIAAPSFSYDSATGTITAVSPPGLAGTVPVTVVTPGGSSAVSADDYFTYTAAPAVSAVALNSGPYEGGTTVTLSGTNFSGATAVDFGGVAATGIDVVSSSQIIATSPAGTGTVDVTVTTPDGTSATSPADKFTYNDEPVVTGIAPLTGPLPGGTTVVITGLNFTGATDVYFGGVDVPVTPAMINVGGTTITVASANIFDMVDSQTATGDMVLNGPLSDSYSGGQWSFVLQAQNTGSQTYNDVDFVPLFVWDTATSPYTALSWNNVGQEWTGNSDTFSIGSYDVGSGPTSPLYLPLVQTNTPSSWGGDPTQALASIAPSSSSPAIPLGDFGPGATENFTLTCPANNFNPAVVGFFVQPQPGTIDVTVATPNGTSTTSPADRFTFGSGPMVSGISPADGPLAGGTPVTISGANFTGATDVYFGATAVAVSPSMVNAGGTTITLTSPAGAAGEVDVTVATGNGVSTTSSADQFTYFNAPTATAISPALGPVAGSTPVTITGSGLANATAVDFGANPATIVSDTNSQIVVLSPAATGGSPGSVSVTVTTANGTATAPSFTYLLPPAVTSIFPTSGPAAGGTTVTIYGANLSGATAVDFGGIAATSFTVHYGLRISDTTITAVSPPGDVSIVDVTVFTGGGGSISSPADQFTYLPAPSILSISSNVGTASFAGGASLSIIGSGLANATAVNFGGISASIVSDTDNQIVVDVPSSNGYLGTVDVTVVTAGGTSATSEADQFTYVPAPGVTSISPSSGFSTGGGLVTIYGTNLDNATAVDFGQAAGTIVDESADAIDVVPPAGAVGAAVVTVVTPGGTSSTSKQDLFTYLTPPPGILGLSQTTGPASGGTTITITGTNLEGATAVDFGTTPGTIVAGSDTGTQITVVSPAGSTGAVGIVGTVDVTVTTPGGTSATSLLDQFTTISPPAVSSIVSQATASGGAAGSIAAGPLSGETEVVINGTDLDGATAVYFGKTAGTIITDADLYVIALSPAGAAGPVDVTVTTPYGTSATSPADQFTYVAAPSAAADSYTAPQDAALTVPAAGGVLANDTDPQGLPLSATLLTDPADGTLSFNSDGSFTYTPNSGYFGPDSFTYEATDGYASSAPATVSINVVPATMTWTGGSGIAGEGSTGNWTDQTWSGATLTLPYPDGTVSAIVETPSVVQVTSNQTAYALAVSNGGEVAVGPGAVLTVTTNFSISGGGTLNVDPNGALFVDGTAAFNATNLSGGPIFAGAYQFNDGTVSADLSGPGGLTVGGGKGGTVILSGANSYAGGTVVNSGTLVVTNSGALPAGMSLTVRAGASLAFGASASGSSLSAVGLAASATDAAAVPASTPLVAPATAEAAGSPVKSSVDIASVATTTTAGPAQLPAAVAEPASTPSELKSPAGAAHAFIAQDESTVAAPAAMPSAAGDSVFKSDRLAFDRIDGPADAAPSARSWASLTAAQGTGNSANHKQTADAAVAALEKVFAQYGV